MSIQSEITRIAGNVTAALTAIGNKGVTVPSGSDSDDLATLIAQIKSGLEYKTGTWTPTSNVLSDGTCSTISLGTHTECPAFILMIDNGTSPAKSSVTMWLYYDIYQLFDKGCPYGAYQTGYGGIVFWTRGSSNSGLGGQLMCTHSSSETGSTTEYCSYFATASSFKPAISTSSTYYWRSGRTYKWIAVWK